MLYFIQKQKGLAEEQRLPTQSRIGHFIQMYSADASDKDVLHETKQGLKKQNKQ